MNIWLIGAGIMSLDYIKVLQYFNANATVIGRGEASARKFTEKSGIAVHTGGIDAFLATQPPLPDAAIVSVNVETLYQTSKALIQAGVKKLLVEKPAGLNLQEIRDFQAYAKEKDACVVLGYNRRFYASVLAAQKMIMADGGPTSFTFEFTEWAHVISKLDKPKEALKNWFLANSSHVVDMAFFLGGQPKQISCFTAGTLDWHPSASAFTGAGITTNNVPFSYHANWASPGRWGVEILTNKRRYIFRPLEQLHIQEIGSVAITKMEIDDSLDIKYKPGLYLQVKNFLEGNLTNFCTLDNQAQAMDMYSKIANITE